MLRSEETADVEAVDRQLEAFNRHDLSAFLACYAEGATLASLSGGIFVCGAAEMTAYYHRLFADLPEIKAELVHRIEVGTMVIDHERIFRSASPADQRDSVVTYRINPRGLIDAVWFAR